MEVFLEDATVINPQRYIIYKSNEDFMTLFKSSFIEISHQVFNYSNCR